ncbi:MAG TPA: lipopolysaccharide kinase InaA family protein, partial [Halomonas sp.]|nr:lipopolysaccharide kinase InaA family protein [Halomonas sp.]
SSTSTTQAFEAVGSSLFYLSRDQRILAKVVPDKFIKRRFPIKWLLRDYMEKRWLWQSDARKEYLSLQILRRAGLKTPECLGWGLSLNPGNRNASLLLMEHMVHARPGGELFIAMGEAYRQRFLDLFCKQVMQLAKAGYLHRDLHYNNLLITTGGEFVWIDTHVKRLPNRQQDQWLALAKTLTNSKLYGEEYREYVEQQLHSLWHTDQGLGSSDINSRY